MRDCSRVDKPKGKGGAGFGGGGGGRELKKIIPKLHFKKKLRF